MSRVDLDTGRKNQKLRTRKALLTAAQQLMEAGHDPSIDDIAEKAMVSRATAYRYFGSVDQLILEATLVEATLEDGAFGAALDFSTLLPDDAAQRAAQVQAYLYDHVQANEVSFRLFLSGVNKAWVESGGEVDLRSGRRLPMIRQALEPVRETLDPDVYDRLIYALAGMMGIESLTIMRDICELDHDKAKATMNWAVRTLVSAVLHEHDSE